MTTQELLAKLEKLVDTLENTRGSTKFVTNAVDLCAFLCDHRNKIGFVVWDDDSDIPFRVRTSYPIEESSDSITTTSDFSHLFTFLKEYFREH